MTTKSPQTQTKPFTYLPTFCVYARSCFDTAAPPPGTTVSVSSAVGHVRWKNEDASSAPTKGRSQRAHSPSLASAV